MIFSQTLHNTFTTLQLIEFSDSLERFISDTFLTPNDLNVNPISLRYIVDNRSLLKRLYETISPEDISSNLDEMFLKIFNKSILEINRNIILISKTKFLQLIVSTFIYGMLMELKDFETVANANNPFNLY